MPPSPILAVMAHGPRVVPGLSMVVWGQPDYRPRHTKGDRERSPVDHSCPAGHKDLTALLIGEGGVWLFRQEIITSGVSR